MIVLLKNNLLPISINYQLQEELKVEKENNSKTEAEKKAVSYVLKKVKSKLKDKECVNDYKVLSSSENGNIVSVQLFYSLIEDITDYMKIDKYEKIKEENDQS